MVNVILTGRRALPPGKRHETTRTVLVGVRQEGFRLKSGWLRELGSSLAARDEIAYWDGASPGRGRPGFREKRAEVRSRARLRSAKLLDVAYRFLCEVRICDRSFNGLRIMLARDVRLPVRIAVHIDESHEVRCARMIWRRGTMLGVRLLRTAPHAELKPSARFALRERYYAIPD